MIKKYMRLALEWAVLFLMIASVFIIMGMTFGTDLYRTAAVNTRHAVEAALWAFIAGVVIFIRRNFARQYVKTVKKTEKKVQENA